MIELTILNYLEKKLEVPVYMEDPNEVIESYVLIEKTGSGGNAHLKNAVIAIQSYAPTLYQAALLNEKVKEAMEKIIELNSVTRCDLNSDYNYTDTSKKQYRYQAIFDITHY